MEVTVPAGNARALASAIEELAAAPQLRAGLRC